MYSPPKFRQTDLAELKRLTAAFPLATVAAETASGTDAAHLPLYWHDDGSPLGVLRGHFAKANPFPAEALPGREWLAVFLDSGHYISPDWYPGKAQHHKEVPTWNYRAAHIRGLPRLITDEAGILDILDGLTALLEAGRHRPWSLADAPAGYLSAMSRAVVGVEIRITRVEGQYKLSQNRTADTRAGILDGLAAENTPQAAHMAGLIRRFSPPDPQDTP